MLRHPLITASYPDKTALPLVRKWARQLRTDLAEVLGYTLVSTGDTIRLRRVQDTLDTTRPAADPCAGARSTAAATPTWC